MQTLRAHLKDQRIVPGMDSLRDLLRTLVHIQEKNAWFTDHLNELRSITRAQCGEGNSWDDIAEDFQKQTTAVDRLIQEASRRSLDIQSGREAVLADWEASIFDLDAAGMLARFKTEYVGLLGRLKPAYLKDIKALRLCARQIGVKLDNECVNSILNRVKEIQDNEAWFETKRSALAPLLGNEICTFSEDWDRLRVKKRTEAAKTLRLLNEARHMSEEVRQAEEDLLRSWNAGVLSLDAARLSERAAGEYTDAFSVRYEQYKEDKKPFFCTPRGQLAASTAGWPKI